MYLGLDLGTTNVKAIVTDEHGHVVAEGSAPVSRMCLAGGGVEQDIEQIFAATIEALSQVARRCDGIAAIGVSSQGGAMQWLEGDDRPAGPVVSWLDGRGRAFDEQLDRELGESFFADHVGRGRSVLTPGQILRLREEKPPWLARAEKVSFVGDWIVGRLCGRRAHDATSLSIAMLLNPRLGRADPELLARLGLVEGQLPDLLPATDPAGALLAEVAEQTGLPAGIPVSPAVHDQYAASIGVGAAAEGDVCLGTGTAWVLLANVARFTRPATPETFVCPHPAGNLYGQMLSMTNGGSSLDWAMKLTGQQSSSVEQVDGLLESVAPGAGGLCCWPLLSPLSSGAEGLPDGGRFSGIRLEHGPAEVIRAVVEGLACELNRHFELLVAARVPVRRVLMCGTAAASRVTPQIVADVVRRPVVCGPESSVSALGAAVIARALAAQQPLGPLATEMSAARRTEQRTFHPVGAEIYRELIARYHQPFDG